MFLKLEISVIEITYDHFIKENGFFYKKKTKMKYITTKNVIVAAQGVLNNHGKNKVMSRIQSCQSIPIHNRRVDHQL